MSKRFKSQASSARAASSAFGSPSAFGFGSTAGGFQTAASPLSYVTELPDLSGISDPQVVVTFKNLGKKDSTTKAKALEELQEYLSSPKGTEGGVESHLLEAWIGLYPRTSIDNSRRVRQLTHSLQGTLTVAGGRRIAPHLSKAIGAWLAGTYDSDRAVARSAQDALQMAFSTPEKKEKLWEIYREALLDYVDDAMLVQTQQSLSDERTTSPDDSQTKHVRVVSTAAFVLLQLIERKSESSSKKDNTEYTKLLNAGKLWEYAYHGDSSLRRSVYALILSCLAKLQSCLDWSVISTCFLSKALHISQLGSSRQYSEVLLAITEARPQLWTSDYTSKTSASRRLFQYVKKGSQRGPPDVWTNIGRLLREIPIETWSPTAGGTQKATLETAGTLLTVLHEGVSNVEEPRMNALTAWSTYCTMCFWSASILEAGESKDELFQKHLYPLIMQHIANTADQSQWSMGSVNSMQVCSSCLFELGKSEKASRLTVIWSQLVEELINTMKLSLPETSKEFKSSQDAVIAKATRLFELQQDLLRKAFLPPLRTIDYLKQSLDDGTSRVVGESIELLKTRNGKPFGAAAILVEVVPLLPKVSEKINEFLRTDISTLLESSSAERLVSLLLRCKTYPSYATSLETCVSTLINNSSLQNRDALIGRILREIQFSDLSTNSELAKFLQTSLDEAFLGNLLKWKIVNAVIWNTDLVNASPEKEADGSPGASKLPTNILQQMMASLSVETRRDAAMSGFDAILSDGHIASQVFPASLGNELLSKLVIISDSQNDNTARRASEIVSKLKDTMTTQGTFTVASSTSEILENQFDGSGQFMSVFGMVELAQEALRETAADKLTDLAPALFPSRDQWQNALAPFLAVGPAHASSITSGLQGTVYAVDQPRRNSRVTFPRDFDDFTIAMRLALYTTKLMKATDALEFLDTEYLRILYLFYPQVLQLVNAKLTLNAASSLWLNSTPEVVDEAAELMSHGQSIICGWASTAPGDQSRSASTSLEQLWLDQMPNIVGTSPHAYILGMSFTSVMTECVDAFGPAKYTNIWSSEMKSLHLSDEIVKSASLTCILQDTLASSAGGKRLCNELVADATELKDLQQPIPALRPLVLLNILLHGEDDLLQGLPTQRVVFLFQNLVKLLRSEESPYAIISEILKLLCSVVPVVCEIYGEYWEQILDTMVKLWSHENDLRDDLPALHSSLRLYARLRSLIGKDTQSNEDLTDAWKSHKLDLDLGLLQVLQLCAEADAGYPNQPLDISVDLLRRQLSFVDTAALGEAENLYHLLASEEYTVQSTGYELLHRAIPAKQEQISLDLALEKKMAHLPDELLSLLLHVPALPTQPASEDASELNNRRRYLLSWAVVFDHFTNASFKLREVYVNDIKECNQLPLLLNFLCTMLRIASGKPLDVSKYDMKDFIVATQNDSELESRHLAVYLYFHCLLHVPGLAKDWYIEQKNRIKSPLESWTQKYISPSIVSVSLTAATEWAASQEQDDRPITLKSSLRSTELIASIVIDEESPSISLSISVSGAYPLEQASVTGRNRVGVSAKNWESWLRTFQIIIFSTGSIIEGLIAFRRNVQGALKGQSECAICYSIIGTDMQTPNKKCGTCKNTFHSVCLFKWFKSSNSSSCPLCRNNFNYA